MDNLDKDTLYYDKNKSAFYYQPEVCEGNIEFKYEYAGNKTSLKIKCEGWQFGNFTKFEKYTDRYPGWFGDRDTDGFILEIGGVSEMYAFLTACKKLLDEFDSPKYDFLREYPNRDNLH